MIMISTMIFFSFHKQAQTCSGLKRKTKASKSTWYCLVFMLRQFQALYFLYFVFCISFHRFPQICCATPPTTALSRSKSKVLLMMRNSLGEIWKDSQHYCPVLFKFKFFVLFVSYFLIKTMLFKMKTTKSDDQYNTQRGSCDSDEANAMVIRISSIKILLCEIESIEWSWIWNVQYTSY